MKPKLSTKTPDDEATNALIDGHADIVSGFNSRSKPNRHLALIEIAATDVKYFEGGDRQATVQVRHLELIPADRETEAEALFTAIHRERTGNTTRPQHPDAAPEDPTVATLDGLDDSVD